MNIEGHVMVNVSNLTNHAHNFVTVCQKPTVGSKGSGRAALPCIHYVLHFHNTFSPRAVYTALKASFPARLWSKQCEGRGD